jgi:hypothetical protein
MVCSIAFQCFCRIKNPHKSDFVSFYNNSCVFVFFAYGKTLFGGDLYGEADGIGDSLEKIFIKYLGFNFSVILIAFALIFLVTRIFQSLSQRNGVCSVWRSFVEDIQSWKKKQRFEENRKKSHNNTK